MRFEFRNVQENVAMIQPGFKACKFNSYAILRRELYNENEANICQLAIFPICLPREGRGNEYLCILYRVQLFT